MSLPTVLQEWIRQVEPGAWFAARDLLYELQAAAKAAHLPLPVRTPTKLTRELHELEGFAAAGRTLTMRRHSSGTGWLVEAAPVQANQVVVLAGQEKKQQEVPMPEVTSAQLEEVRKMAQQAMDQTVGLGQDDYVRLQQLARHGPGLCSDGPCAYCKRDRAAMAQEIDVRTKRATAALLDEMTTACAWAGIGDQADAVVEAVTRWRAAGKPDPASPDLVVS